MFFGAVKMAFTSIAAHKARAVLTTLGVVIGVSSVITLLAIGEGLKKDVKATINSFGSDTLFITPGNLQFFVGGGGANAESNPLSFLSGDILTFQDVEAFEKITGVTHVIPIMVLTISVRTEEHGSGATVLGSYPDIQEVLPSTPLSAGRLIREEDQGVNRMVLGYGPTQQLFGEEDPIGKTVLVGREEFTVIGTLGRSKSGGSLTSGDVETYSLIPYDTAARINGERSIHRIGVKVGPNSDIKEAAEAIRQDIRTRHKEGEVSVLTPDDIIELVGSILNLVATAMSAVAAVSLIVGGIGIMNIMLVSVTERTREIGIRKAVGATRGAILIQFLIEAIVISLLGGLLGLGLAVLGVLIVDLKTALVPAITPFMVSLAVGVSVIVGIIFGLAPAISAARKDPIEALRYE